MAKKGLFITFEGGDGAGKTTLIDKIYSALQKGKRSVFKTRAPGGTEVGKEIRNLLLHKHDADLAKRCELLLFLADRAQHVEELIRPALKKGQIVLCDRFNDSTIAYQGGARGFTAGLVGNLCNFACDGLQPDLTLYLDLDPRIGFERARKAGLSKDRIESETLKFHQNIRKAFKQIAKKEPKRFIIIDASKTPEEVYTQAKEKIDALLKTSRK
ncbi:MAG: dTMP kinase [Verrucomicrobia bacterium]|nr:dTMP kinase [Verrucomicrobiota bacterium]